MLKFTFVRKMIEKTLFKLRIVIESLKWRVLEALKSSGDFKG